MRRPHDDPVLSDAEWTVMNAVWSTGGDITARDVLTIVHPETRWAYTTVKTLLDRLVEKAVLAAEVRGHTAYYRPRLAKQQAVSRAAERLATRAFGGAVAPLVHHLLRSRRLSARDRAELRRLLDEEDAAGGKRGGT